MLLIIHPVALLFHLLSEKKEDSIIFINMYKLPSNTHNGYIIHQKHMKKQALKLHACMHTQTHRSPPFGHTHTQVSSLWLPTGVQKVLAL